MSAHKVSSPYFTLRAKINNKALIAEGFEIMVLLLLIPGKG
jgi:hypothetical protein